MNKSNHVQCVAFHIIALCFLCFSRYLALDLLCFHEDPNGIELLLLLLSADLSIRAEVFEEKGKVSCDSNRILV